MTIALSIRIDDDVSLIADLQTFVPAEPEEDNALVDPQPHSSQALKEEASPMADPPPSDLMSAVLQLTEAVGSFDAQTKYLGDQIRELRQDNTGLTERIGRLDITISNLDGRINYLGDNISELRSTMGELREDIKKLHEVSLSKSQFWMGIGLVITMVSLVVTVILSIAAMYFGLVKP